MTDSQRVTWTAFTILAMFDENLWQGWVFILRLAMFSHQTSLFEVDVYEEWVLEEGAGSNHGSCSWEPLVQAKPAFSWTAHFVNYKMAAFPQEEYQNSQDLTYLTFCCVQSLKTYDFDSLGTWIQ